MLMFYSVIFSYKTMKSGLKLTWPKVMRDFVITWRPSINVFIFIFSETARPYETKLYRKQSLFKDCSFCLDQIKNLAAKDDLVYDWRKQKKSSSVKKPGQIEQYFTGSMYARLFKSLLILF